MAGLVPRLSGSANWVVFRPTRTPKSRHARACHGHPRVLLLPKNTWMRGTSPRMKTMGRVRVARDSVALYQKPNRTAVGLSRPSTSSFPRREHVDARDKPGHDEPGTRL